MTGSSTSTPTARSPTAARTATASRGRLCPPAPVIEKPDENPAQDALVAKINAAAGSSVVITLTEDMTITSPISIPASTVVELKTDGKAVTLTRGEKLTESLFNVLEGSTLKITGKGVEEVEPLTAKLKTLSESSNVNICLLISADAEELPASVREFVAK